MRQPLPLPPWYESNNARVWCYNPDDVELAQSAHDWARQHSVRAAGSDKLRTALVLIDTQNDFCHPSGTLYVGGRSGTGAIDDSRRTAEFIYHNASRLTGIFPTFDTHFGHQIFSAPFWEGAHGEPLTQHSLIIEDAGGKLNNVALDGTTILVRDVRPKPAMALIATNNAGAWAGLYEFCLHYVRELARQGKYTLYLWPPHCLLGKVGHALVGVISEARNFHAYLRGTNTPGEIKGGHIVSENYSVFRPEVMTDAHGNPIAQRNTRFLETLVAHDMVVIGGQAASHCVASSIDDMLEWLVQKDRALVEKVWLLEDCMSAVAVPDGKGGFAADFTSNAQAAIDRFRDAGMHVVKSMTPMENWPGLPAGF